MVIRAPAGFGKTTVMLQMREAMTVAGIRSAWLTLDDLDNNVPRFASFIGSLFEQLTPSHTLAPHESPGGQTEAGFGLLERIANSSEPFAVFLDDFETIHDPAVLAITREIIDSLPPDGQLIIGSRVIPDLGLARLRALGQLFEIEPRQLRFSREEIAEYLVEKRGLKLQQCDLKHLYNATEGWAAALSLVSVSLARREDPRPFIAGFSGSNAALMDYLSADVLSGLAEAPRVFLLETSVLSELSAPSCDWLRDRSDSTELLAELERAQMFLIPLDAQRQLYRYHSLFAQFLREQLRRTFPDRVASLHRAASQWCLDHQRPIAAIEHALAGDDAQSAIAILSQFAQTILHAGRARLLARWLQAIPASMLADISQLRAIHLWALFFSQQPEQALSDLDALEAEVDHEVRHRSIHDDLLALRPLLLLRMDRFEEAFDIGVRNVALLIDRNAFPFSILANSIATMQVVEGKQNAATRMLEEASAVGAGTANPVGTVYSACCEGVVDLMQGRLRQAAARFRFAERSLEPALSVEDVSGNAVAGLFYAVVAYELNQWEDAGRRLRLHLPAIKEQGFPDQVIVGSLALARIAFYQGDIDGAWTLLTELEYFGRREQWPRAVATVRIARSRLLQLRGDVAAASRELEQADVPFLWERLEGFSMMSHDLDSLQIARLRLMVYEGRADRAVPLLRDARDRARQAHRYRRVLQLRILLSMALHAANMQEAALEELHRALSDAGAEGFIRLFVDEGDRVAVLLQQLTRASDQLDVALPTRGYIVKLLAAFGQSREESGQALALSGAGMAEALTRKEFQVLKLLGEGLSNDAMATELQVLDTTVRTHLRSINAKLGANNRTQAVSIARRLGLIS
ncbi:LuxR C-terminal-related transcriptional regulator [Roseateles sp.]|uniref:LuxR C-terminal-related transcriptional regulator n=1 Tax=Roseateles sp. TaxID=1971397 RepID=UPI00286BBE89|nr:LuxR C-terminal-related transcriptional regulator [Roseateles sp.]